MYLGDSELKKTPNPVMLWLKLIFKTAKKSPHELHWIMLFPIIIVCYIWAFLDSLLWWFETNVRTSLTHCSFLLEDWQILFTALNSFPSPLSWLVRLWSNKKLVNFVEARSALMQEMQKHEFSRFLILWTFDGIILVMVFVDNWNKDWNNFVITSFLTNLVLHIQYLKYRTKQA